MKPRLNSISDEVLARLVGEFRAGNLKARDKLIEHTQQRFKQLTEYMLGGFPGLRGRQRPSDVFQGAMLRFIKALGEIKPESADHFLRLGDLQIRRELIDLARRYFGPRGRARDDNSAMDEPDDRASDDDGPSRLAEWTEFHKAVFALPTDELEVVLLLWYQELSQPKAAEKLGIDVRTVRRRWLAARLALARWLPGRDEESDHD